jgi:hypothetical protein
MSKPYIQTHSGARFEFPEPDVDQISIFDIAHALSHSCRFTGHTQIFYSVAEHSVRVAHLAQSAYRSAHKDDEAGAVMVGRWGLLHDASEAYIADIASPVKRLPEMAGYRELEKRIQGIIVATYQLPPDMPTAVRVADEVLVNTEADELLPGGRRFPTDGWPARPVLPGKQGFGWPPSYAEMMFLKAFESLFSSH